MNTTKYALALTFLLASVAAGCGSKGDANKDTAAKSGAAFAGTCNKVTKTSKCDEYNDLTMGLEEGACKELGGTFSTSAACPTADRIGVCKKKSGTTYYYSTKSEVNYTTDIAKLDCENPLIEGKYTELAAPPGAATAAAAANGAPPGDTGATAPASTGKGKHEGHDSAAAKDPGGAAHAGAKAGHKKGK